MEPATIDIKNARVHNLREVCLSLPRNKLIVFTGVSGSGKSSLAFDTLYAEGQRRYIESLSSYARQFMGQMQKPDCDLISGLSPAVAIQQKTTGWNPRSTVATITAIHDFLRVLFARIGAQHCTQCGRPISAQSREQIVAGILDSFAPDGDDAQSAVRALILAPQARAQKGEFRDLFEDLVRAGYVRARVDGRVVMLTDDLALEKNRRHDIEVVVDRLALSPENRSRIAEAVENALRIGKGSLIVAVDTGEAGLGSMRATAKGKSTAREKVFSSSSACTHCGISFEPLSPQLFSFNSPTGMCMKCDGLGELLDFDPDLLVPDPSKNFYAPCIEPMRTKVGKWRRHVYEAVARAVGFDINQPWKKLPPKAREALLYGTGDRHLTFEWKWSGGVWKHGGTFDGVLEELREKHRKAKATFIRDYYEKYMRRGPCPDCAGARLNAQARAVRLPVTSKSRGTTSGNAKGPNLAEFCGLSVARARAMLDALSLSPVQKIVAEDVLKELRTRMDFLLNVGLDYLSLDRTAPTLSGGELQRIRLAGQIGSGLAGVLYILDEPSIGLHHRDNQKLLESLIALRDMGNTVIVVEHDEDTMRAADYVVDFGPGPGVRGGHVVAEGDFDAVLNCDKSLTGQYLSGTREIEVPKQRRVVPPIRLPQEKRVGKARNR